MTFRPPAQPPTHVAPIQKLPEDIIRGIAAGEVVERPAAVLKELLENAVDAGARRVEVEWRDAGRRHLRVTDDGGGLLPGEARLALERHATSKIRALDDLEHLATYGFRGEALPSIAAVSRFTLLTRAPDAPGHRIAVEAGRVVSEGPAAAPPGTTVTVDDLFFAVPARLKFLKSDATERGLLFRTVEDLALAEPGLGVKVISEGREPIALRPLAPGDGEGLRDRLAALWGADRVAGMKPVDAPGRPLRVSGWVSDVNSAHPTARHQRFFINRRPVVNRRLTHALYDAYRGRLPAGRHPAAALILDIDPALVDVNVHPTKREVRLSQEETIRDFLCRAVKDALTRSAQAPAVFTGPRDAPEPPGTPGTAPRFAPPAAPRPLAQEARTAYNLQRPWDPARPEGTEGAGFSRADFRAASFEPVEQLYGTYILARWNGDFFLFDQHAAAERALYERLTADAHGHARQRLLLPWMWELSPETAAVVNDQRDAFTALGFELTPFGGASFRVAAVPAALGDSPRVRDILEGLAADLAADRTPRGPDALTVRAACRGSVMAGQALGGPERAALLRALQACESPWTCPHGRPTFLRLANEDLAKRFRRV